METPGNSQETEQRIKAREFQNKWLS